MLQNIKTLKKFIIDYGLVFCLEATKIKMPYLVDLFLTNMQI